VRLRIVKQIFPRLPECAKPLDLFEAAEPDYPKIFHLPVRSRWDSWELLAVFNYEIEPLQKTVDLARLAVDPRQSYVVWDFWNERYMGVISGRITVNVAPRSVTLLRISRQRDCPWVLSTDMHVRQGQAEIEEVRWRSTCLVSYRAR
jgi:hypothetical protein